MISVCDEAHEKRTTTGESMFDAKRTLASESKSKDLPDRVK